MCFLCTQPAEKGDKCCCNGLHGEEPPAVFVAPEPRIVYVEKEPKEPKEEKPKRHVGRPSFAELDEEERNKPIPKTDLIKRLWKEKIPSDAPFEKKQMGRPPKEGKDMADVAATGRKRASYVAPFEDGMLCEWRGLRFAGGGVKPIVGCAGFPVSHRHHGPDKSVLNNVLFVNLHRICSKCHNRWHALNDMYYGERPPDGVAFVPLDGGGRMHDPHTKATPQEMMENELWWLKSPEERGELIDQGNDPLTSSAIHDTMDIDENDEEDNDTEDDELQRSTELSDL